MLRGRILSILLIPVLLLSIFSIQSINAGEIEKAQDNNFYQFDSGVKHRFIVFPDTKEEYNQLADTETVVASFPHLRALLIEATNKHISTTGMKAFDTSIYKVNMEVPPVVETQITLDSTEDAPLMGVTDLWDLGYSGQGVTVGVVDNGIELTHPGLQGRVLEQQWFETPGDGVRNPFHGTPVSGTIVGSGDYDPMAKGNAYNGTVISAAWRMLSNRRSFATGADDIHYYEAFDYMISKNSTVRIINFSGGGGYFEPLGIIQQRLEEAGMLLIASAGNEGSGMETVGCPACFTEPVAVGATTRDARNSLTSFSSRGPAPIPGLKPDVVAPGDSVYSTTQGGGYGRVSGTSFSSPLTAGAVATLISALNAENYSWNVGTLKASLLRGAYLDSGKMDYLKGAGMVNIYKSYQSIKSENPSSGFAEGLMVTPVDSSLFDLRYFSDDTAELRGYTVITSNASSLMIKVKGDLAQVLSLNMNRWNNASFSQHIPFNVDTTGKAAGTYSGSVDVVLGTINRTISISINVLGGPTGKVLMDLRHTDGELYATTSLTGYDTGLMATHFKDLNYKVEEVSSEITSTLLSNYDVLWMPDLMYLQSLDKQPLLSSEITAIQQFVDSGGSALITYSGVFTSFNGNPDGSDPAEVSRLTSAWGITPYSDVSTEDTSGTGYSLNNISSIVGLGTTAALNGNFMSLSPSVAAGNNAVLRPIQGNESRSFFASYDDLDGGRVVVISSNAVVSNYAIRGNTASSPHIAGNIANWLTSQNRIHLDSVSQTEEALTIRVRSNSVPIAKRLGNVYVPGKSLNVSSLGGDLYEIISTFETDGLHAIEVDADQEYLRFNVVIDNFGPSITPDLANNTVFDDVTYAFVKFTILDPSTTVAFDDITVLFDGGKPDPTLFRTFYVSNVLKVRIPLASIYASQHNLSVSAKDNSGHTSVYNFFFVSQGDGPPPVTTTSTTETVSSSSSTLSTTTEIMTTTVSNSSSISSTEIPSTPTSPANFMIAYGLLLGSLAVLIFKKRIRSI